MFSMAYTNVSSQATSFFVVTALTDGTSVNISNALAVGIAEADVVSSSTVQVNTSHSLSVVQSNGVGVCVYV